MSEDEQLFRSWFVSEVGCREDASAREMIQLANKKLDDWIKDLEEIKKGIRRLSCHIIRSRS